MKIIALDLVKFNTMCCFFDSKTRKHSFLNASTDRKDLSTIFKQHWGKIDLVIMEACGPSGWINDLAMIVGNAMYPVDRIAEGSLNSHVKSTSLGVLSHPSIIRFCQPLKVSEPDHDSRNE